MYQIMIAENIPSLNKGELAILKGMMESFAPLGEVKVKIVSSLSDQDKKRYGDKIEIINVQETFHLKKEFNYNRVSMIFLSILINIKHIVFLILYKILGTNVTKIMKSDIWKEYINSEVIFVGHNGVFGIGGGLIGNYLSVLTLLSYIYLPFFGKTLQKPLVIYGGSISHYSSFLLKRWMSFLLNRIDLITLREYQSLENLHLLNYTANNAHLTADLAFLMNPVSNDILKKIIKNENINLNSILIGVTVTREKAISAYKDLRTDESYNKHSKIVANVLDYLVEKKNAEIIFLPHCIGLGEYLDDRNLSKDIFKKCENRDKIKVLKKEYSSEELKALMGICDFFIGERLHSVIGAMSMKVPSIVLSNTSDMRLQIIRDIGQENSICYVDDMEGSELIKKIEEMWNVRDQIKKDLEKEIKFTKEKSMLNGFLLKKLISK